jgi:hypothetical protein
MVMTDVTTTLPPVSSEQLLVAAGSQTGTPYHHPWLPHVLPSDRFTGTSGWPGTLAQCLGLVPGCICCCRYHVVDVSRCSTLTKEVSRLAAVHGVTCRTLCCIQYASEHLLAGAIIPFMVGQ